MRRPSIFEFLALYPTMVGNKVRLRLKQVQDAPNDYNWRKDVELASLDATLPISSSFEEYLEWYIEKPPYHPPHCHLTVETLEGRHIGNYSCFNIDDKKREAEMGIMIGDKDYWNQGYGTDAVRTALNNILEKTNLERIYLKTLDWNIRAQKCFEKCGFIPQGQLFYGEHSFIIMEIHRTDQTYIDNESGQNDNHEGN